MRSARGSSPGREERHPAAQAGSIFDLVDKFAGYGFNKSHAAAYAVVSYQTAWLKANAPVEFFAASMSLDIANTDKLSSSTRTPSASGEDPAAGRQPLRGRLRGGRRRGALRPGRHRNVGLQAMEHVVAVRREGGPFRDIFDFVERVDPKQVTSALSRPWPGPAPSTPSTRTAPSWWPPPMCWSHGQALATDRAEGKRSLFGEDAGGGARPRAPKAEPWTPSTGWITNSPR